VADEFLDINSSYAYFKTGIWQNWDFNFEKVNADNVFQARDERAGVYKWQVAELFNFLPPTESTARTISVLWGILTIALIYFVATDFTKKKMIGLIGAFLFAISTSGISLIGNFGCTQCFCRFISLSLGFYFVSWRAIIRAKSVF